MVYEGKDRCEGTIHKRTNNLSADVAYVMSRSLMKCSGPVALSCSVGFVVIRGCQL
jgi:hypothetical protein